MARKQDSEAAILKSRLRRLSSPFARVRSAALAEARSLPPDERLRLMEALLAYCDRSVGRAGLPIVIGILCGVALGYVFNALGWRDYFVWAILCVIAGGIVGTALMLARLTKAEQSLEMLATACPDTRLLPAVLTRRPEQKDQDQSAYFVLRRTLLKSLLPHLKAGEADSWTNEQKDHAAAYLQLPFIDLDCTLALAQAAKTINDPTVMEAARRLAKISPAMVYLRTPLGRAGAEFTEKVNQIKRAALECDPARTLLRASSAPSTTAPEELLRPAQATISETPPEQLLRPQ